jgi:hypothetical protein
LEIPAIEFSHRHLLEVVSDARLGIEFWCIAGEALQVDPLGRDFTEEVLDGIAGVDRRVSLYDQQLTLRRSCIIEAVDSRHDT